MLGQEKREGVRGREREMTQTLYAHMNKQTKKCQFTEFKLGTNLG
jgi:hypothetical protein